MNEVPKFTTGEVVYHVACGTRGVVVAVTDHGDCYRYVVAFGVSKGGELICHPKEISTEPNYSANPTE